MGCFHPPIASCFQQAGCKAYLTHQLEQTPASDPETHGASPSCEGSRLSQITAPTHLVLYWDMVGPARGPHAVCHQEKDAPMGTLPGGRDVSSCGTHWLLRGPLSAVLVRASKLCGEGGALRPTQCFLHVSPESGNFLKSRGHLLPPSGARGAWPRWPVCKERALIRVRRLGSTVKITGKLKALPPDSRGHGRPVPRTPHRLHVPAHSLFVCTSCKVPWRVCVSRRCSQCSVSAPGQRERAPISPSGQPSRIPRSGDGE